jgi:hypothetical protein
MPHEAARRLAPAGEGSRKRKGGNARGRRVGGEGERVAGRLVVGGVGWRYGAPIASFGGSEARMPKASCNAAPLHKQGFGGLRKKVASSEPDDVPATSKTVERATTRAVMVLVAVVCLGLTAFGSDAPAKDLVISGKGLIDVSAAPGTSIKKSGEGVAIVAVKDGGKYTVSMDGPGTLYLIGMYDYSSVEVISKTGDGDLVWVPLDPDTFSAGPTVKGKIDGNGKIRSGTQKEVNDLRSKYPSPGS